VSFHVQNDDLPGRFRGKHKKRVLKKKKTGFWVFPHRISHNWIPHIIASQRHWAAGAADGVGETLLQERIISFF
jgi:hypothetical protein